MKDVSGKVVVVTGGAAGIGFAFARRFADAGARIVLADIELDVLEGARVELADSGVDVLALPCDVSKHEDLVAVADAAMEHFGAIHVICNNAGVGGGGNSWEIPIDEWRWILDVDLWGVIYGINVFVPHIIASGGGHVINTASAAGLTSVPFMGPYNVAKHGVVTLSETLYHELQMSHPEVGVTVVCPGWVRTGIAESARNRPAGLAGGEPAEGGEIIGGVIATLVASGLEPSHVADAVFEAVTENRVYVLTHDEWSRDVTERVRRITEGENPVMNLPAQ